MPTRRRFAGPLFSTLVALFVLGLAAPHPANAQLLKKIKNKAAEKATDEAAEAAVGELPPLPGSTGTSGDEDRPDLGTIDANYDFQPGDSVLFEDDYSNDEVGALPERMRLLEGIWDVVEWNDGRWLRNTGPRWAALKIPLLDTLPRKFTIEFDVYLPHANQQLLVATAPPPEHETWGRVPGHAFRVGVAGTRTGVYAPADRNEIESLSTTEEVGQRPVPIRITVDGKDARMFVGTRRVANTRVATFERTDALYLVNINFASAENPMMIGPIRIATMKRELYDVLEEEGRYTARGILFDVDRADIRPESDATLDAIGATLEEHPELRLSIEGHTDSDGDEAANLDLSERRAAAVRSYLLEHFDVDPSRLETKGFGETAPVASNDTPEGKQRNRRVELLRLEDAGSGEE
ncbi:MAG: OmpA family protein [Gemmatimonadales bacterium]|jgi:outer membrane protein OmpA-like peptidoglycan-associated protein